MSNQNKELIVELYCVPCDEPKEYTFEEYKKITDLQKMFENEWKDEEICLGCAKRHRQEITGLYTEEECEEQEKDLLSKGFYLWKGRWVARGGGVIMSYRMMNKINCN